MHAGLKQCFGMFRSQVNWLTVCLSSSPFLSFFFNPPFLLCLSVWRFDCRPKSVLNKQTNSWNHEGIGQVITVCDRKRWKERGRERAGVPEREGLSIVGSRFGVFHVYSNRANSSLCITRINKLIKHAAKNAKKKNRAENNWKDWRTCRPGEKQQFVEQSSQVWSELRNQTAK